MTDPLGAIRALGISRMIANVLPLGPKKLRASPGCGLAGLAGFGRGNVPVPVAMNAANPPASKKNGSSWMALRYIPPPATGMFCPVLPWATIPVGGNFVEGMAVRLTSCTPLASGGPNAVRRVRSSSALPLVSILMSQTVPGSAVAGVRTPGNGWKVKTKTVLAGLAGDWKTKMSLMSCSPAALVLTKIGPSRWSAAGAADRGSAAAAARMANIASHAPGRGDRYVVIGRLLGEVGGPRNVPRRPRRPAGLPPPPPRRLDPLPQFARPRAGVPAK